ncbi:Uncharacterised protein [Mycobacteroides abscessus subsp. abscessus]|nr:Uncharacterised protein [Mycobacteroides abscessus subsp. abscessus]
MGPDLGGADEPAGRLAGARLAAGRLAAFAGRAGAEGLGDSPPAAFSGVWLGSLAELSWSAMRLLLRKFRSSWVFVAHSRPRWAAYTRVSAAPPLSIMPSRRKKASGGPNGSRLTALSPDQRGSHRDHHGDHKRPHG